MPVDVASLSEHQPGSIHHAGLLQSLLLRRLPLQSRKHRQPAKVLRAPGLLPERSGAKRTGTHHIATTADN